MKNNICFLLNSVQEYCFEDLLQHYLPADKYDITIAFEFPDDPSAYRLIVPWNYKKIIKQAESSGNVIVMHASGLPEGRGWAPIYYTFIEEKTEYILSGIYAANEVDTGDIIIQAKFPIKSEYTASFIRELDAELSLLLIAKIMEQWPASKPVGGKQIGDSSYRQRRYPRDNEIDISMSIENLIPHLRGVESRCPAFFIYNNVRYIIEIKPDIKPDKPDIVMIEYPALNKKEKWCGWQ